MRRNPFVWEVQVRREVLEAELARLRELPYSLWHDVVGQQVCKSARGRDDRLYRIRVSATWAQTASKTFGSSSRWKLPHFAGA